MQEITNSPKELNFYGFLKDVAPEVKRILPQHLHVERMLGLVLTEARKNPKLFECTTDSIMAAIMQSAKIGLEPGVLEQCYFIPYFNNKKRHFECNFVIGYKGLLELIMRGGHVSTVEARERYENDTFRIIHGTKKELYHEPYIDGDRGAVKGYYAIVEMKDGRHIFDYMSREEIEAHRRKHEKRAGQYSPWDSNFDEMAKKTIVRKTIKMLPVSVEYQNILTQSDDMDSVEPNDDIIDAEPVEVRTAIDRKGYEEKYGGWTPPADTQPQEQPKQTQAKRQQPKNTVQYDPYMDESFLNTIPPERGRRG